MTANDPLRHLESWFRNHCDGDWEHDHRIKIHTIDNPGWMIEINLAGTFDRDLQFEGWEIHRSEGDWFACSLDGDVFRGFGGAANLGEPIATFVGWVTSYERGAGLGHSEPPPLR